MATGEVLASEFRSLNAPSPSEGVSPGDQELHIAVKNSQPETDTRTDKDSNNVCTSVTPEDPPIQVPPTVPSSGISIQAHKLWLGNLDKRLTEQNILKFVSPYGKVVSFKYLLHTSGIEKGEPRGYCFVEYSTKEEAERAKSSLHGKLALGRKITVDWARPDMSARKTGNLVSETWDPSSVSATLQGDASKKAKIAAIEAKLRQMENESSGGMPPTKAQHLPAASQTRSTNIVGHIYAPHKKHGGHNLKMHRLSKPYSRIEIRTRK